MSDRIIIARRLRDGGTSVYERPGLRAIISHFAATDGTQYDKIERGPVTGGIPLAWARIEASASAPQVALE